MKITNSLLVGIFAMLVSILLSKHPEPVKLPSENMQMQNRLGGNINNLNITIQTSLNLKTKPFIVIMKMSALAVLKFQTLRMFFGRPNQF